MKIAIVKLSALGDIVHAMAVLQFIKKASPDTSIDWIVEEKFAALLEHNPDINNILPVNIKAIKKDKTQLFQQIKLLRRYAQNKYDIVIDAQGLIKSAIVSRLLGKSAGFDKNSTREPAASLFYSQCYNIPYVKNVIERNFLLAMQALKLSHDLAVLKKKEPFLFYEEKEREKTLHFFSKEKKNILYILGSSWKSKIYPKEKFAEVIVALEENPLLLWGSQSEKEDAEFIAKNTHAKVLPKLDLNELKALIASADLVIGGDSGPTHMAWALNRPSITLFGPTPSWRNTLTTGINKTVDCGQSIDPCKLDKTDACIKKIKVESIIIMAGELLNA